VNRLSKGKMVEHEPRKIAKGQVQKGCKARLRTSGFSVEESSVEISRKRSGVQ
jgi:hypothetical protein